MAEIGPTNVARAVGVSQRRVTQIAAQKHQRVWWTVDGERRTAEYDIKQMLLTTVDEWMGAFGEHPMEIYGDRYFGAKQ